MDEITVRVGTLDDLDAMMELSWNATQENAVVEPDMQMILKTMYPSLMLNGGVVGIIGEPGEHIEGAILLRIGNLWYSTVPIIEERAVYVDPQYRAAKGGRLKKLADFAKLYANSLDLVLAIGVLSSMRTEAKERAYSRIFGSPAGAYYLYNGTTGAAQAAE